MTIRRQMWINGVPQFNLDETSLEGVALKLKATKNSIDNLNSKYEILMDEVAKVKELQKKKSEEYKELKLKLVELAEEIDDKTEE